MVQSCDEHPEIANYDRRLAHYFEKEGIDCWYSVPSLVDHRVGPQNPSLVPGRSAAAGRVAFAYIGDVSPLDIDWSTPPLVELPAPQQAWWRHTATGRIRRTTLGSPLDRSLDRRPEWERAVRSTCSKCGQRVYDTVTTTSKAG
jgi:hypothetical protein